MPTSLSTESSPSASSSCLTDKARALPSLNTPRAQTQQELSLRTTAWTSTVEQSPLSTLAISQVVMLQASQAQPLAQLASLRPFSAVTLVSTLKNRPLETSSDKPAM